MAEGTGAAKSTHASMKIDSRAVGGRCYYCNREGHFVRECPKRELDRLENLKCYGCGGSGHMKRECPNFDTKNSTSSAGGRGKSQQPKYSRRSSSPSTTSANALSAGVKCYNEKGDGHDWGKGYRLGSASDSASQIVTSYNSAAEGEENKSDGDQSDKREDLSQDASGEGHFSKDVTDSHSSECSLQASRPLKDVQSDSSKNGTRRLSNGTSNDPPSSSSSEASCRSECDSSQKDELNSRIERSSPLAKDVAEKRRQSHFPPFIDTHCHLDYVFDRYHHHGTFKDFTDRLSYPTNFEGCISTFCDPAAFSSLGAWRELLSEPNVWGTFGIHPHNAKYYHKSGLEDKVLEGLQHPKCVAFGEIGLDYSDHSPSDPPIQKDILRQQLQLVVPFGKPVVLHCRDAEQDLFEILTHHLPRDWFIHLHSFTGEPHVARQFLNEFPNLYLGVCGNLTNTRQVNTRTVVREVPLERLLIETDAPYHVPYNLPKAGWRRNSHPALAFYVAKEIAKLRKEDLVDVLKATRTNTRALYGI